MSKDKEKKLSRKRYEKKLGRLQDELVKLQEWIRHENLKVLVLFEGRDAAGKGGMIKRILEPQAVELPSRQADAGYVRPPLDEQPFVPDVFKLSANSCFKDSGVPLLSCAR